MTVAQARRRSALDEPRGRLARLGEAVAARVDAGEPCIIKHANLGRFADSTETFSWFQEACPPQQPSLAVRFFGGAEPIEQWKVDASPDSRRDVRLAPMPADATFDGYLDRIGSLVEVPGILVNNFQVASPALWQRTTALLHRVFSDRELPFGGVLLDLFVGRYRSGFFGVHKDDQDVVTFVVEGEKRFRLWSFEALGTGADHDRLRSVRLGAEPVELPEPAFDFVATPGDVVFWPADYWHAVETDGRTTATLSLGLFPRASVAGLHRILGEPAAGRAGIPFDAGAEAIRRAVIGAALPQNDVAIRGCLEFATAFGFDSGPSFNVVPNAALALRTLRAVSAAHVRWVAGLDGILVVAAGGRSVRWPDHRGVRLALQRICAGTSFSVRSLYEQIVSDGVCHDQGMVLVEANLVRLVAQLLNVGALQESE